jgi:alpha-D-xyloside xylohydrolase
MPFNGYTRDRTSVESDSFYHWDDRADTVTIGARDGSYPSMPSQRNFSIVLVSHDHGAGPGITAQANQRVVYSGSLIKVGIKP